MIALEHKLKSSEDIIVIDWGISDVCNYNCSYCPPDTHKGKYPFYPKDKVIAFADKIFEHFRDKMGKEVYFIFTGGEVTLFKDFIPLLKELKKRNGRVGISTNGSKDIDFWKEAQEYLEHISFSYHDEYTDLDHFIDAINAVKDKPYTHVNIMINPDAFEKCINAAYRVYNETDNITMDLQIILKEFIEPYHYTAEQKERILEVSKDIYSRFKLKREIKGYRGDGFMKIIHEDKTEEYIKAGDIVTKNLNRWKGWECNIGLELLVVDTSGDITRSWCTEGGVIGNVNDDVINFPDKPFICPCDNCHGGITDMMTTKRKVT